MNKKELKRHYPLCFKYNVPIENGIVALDVDSSWLKALPEGWAERFGEVMGCVTCSTEGYYVCDIEDTLWALQNGKSQRRWNG